MAYCIWEFRPGIPGFTYSRLSSHGTGRRRGPLNHDLSCTLWICQHSYWKWPIYSWFTFKKMVIFYSYVSLPEGRCSYIFWLPTLLHWGWTIGLPCEANLNTMMGNHQDSQIPRSLVRTKYPWKATPSWNLVETTFGWWKLGRVYSKHHKS